jgi:catecholate siderophore receptor
MKRHLAGIFGMALATATVRRAHAADAQLPEIVVTGERKTYQPKAVSSPKYTQPLIDIPQTVTVIPQAIIEEQGASTLRDVLRNVPGISIQAGEGGVPAGDNLSVRGFNARTDIFVDGVRDFGGYTRDSFNIEQVEVSKGRWRSPRVLRPPTAAGVPRAARSTWPRRRRGWIPFTAAPPASEPTITSA